MCYIHTVSNHYTITIIFFCTFSRCSFLLFVFFFFQAEDGIRDLTVTGVQTCALPILFNGIPVSYFSLKDFLNLCVQLRTVPEIVEYLDRRRALPVADLRTIGEERSLFAFYLLNEGSFAGCLGITDAKIAVAAQKNRFEERLRRKLESDRFSGLLEHVANELATRLPHYAAGLPPGLLAAFDNSFAT